MLQKEKLEKIPLRVIMITALFCSLSFIQCKRVDEAPMGATDFRIDLRDARNLNLATSGGWEYYTGGYNGVVVFNQGWNFVAFERACPINHNCKVEVTSSFSILTCPCCNSQFINTDGSPIQGEARSSLRQYIARYDGVRFIRITSF